MGKSISLDDSGDVLAVGTWLSNEQSGHVGVYSYDQTWEQIGTNIEGEQPGDKSGTSVSLSGNGKRVAIGASHYDTGSMENNGQCRVYELSKDTWVKQGST